MAADQDLVELTWRRGHAGWIRRFDRGSARRESNQDTGGDVRLAGDVRRDQGARRDVPVARPHDHRHEQARRDVERSG